MTVYITPEQYEIAEKNGISKLRVQQRIMYSDWSIEDAITIPPKKPKQYPKMYVELAKKNGIRIETFRNRVNNLGWTYEEASTKEVRKHVRKKI